MTDSPWLLLSVAAPLLAAPVVQRIADPTQARRWSLVVTGFTLLAALAAWLQFEMTSGEPAAIGTPGFPGAWLSLDQLSAPLGSLAALLYFVTMLVTLRTKLRRFSFGLTLFSEGITLATLACREPWGIVLLLSIGTIFPLIELRARRQPVRLYAFHMGAFVLLLVSGQLLEDFEGADRFTEWWASLPLLVAVLLRSGTAPFHLWVTDLFERASFGRALLFVTPMLGAYAAVRLLIPVSPDWVLRSIALLSLFTAVYTAGLATVQQEARRFFCCIFLSHSALVLVGLELVTEIGLTGALCIWLSVGLSLAGFGLTLRAVESRRGRAYLDGYQGLYEHAPSLAVFYALTGLACVGFPGTISFVGTELLFDGVVETYPLSGAVVVIAAALNGIAIVRSYFAIFTGTRHQTNVSLQIRGREKLAVLTLAALILIGGILPGPGVVSRFRAARDLLSHREPLLKSRPDRAADPHGKTP